MAAAGSNKIDLIGAVDMPRILYVSMHDPEDVRAWSGTVHHMARMLEQQGLPVEYLPNVVRDRRRLLKAVERSRAFVTGRKPAPVDRKLSTAQMIATAIEQRLQRTRANVIFAPSSIPIAMLRTNRLKVFHTDATFAGIIHQYPELANYPKEYMDEGHELERRALHNCDLAIYSSHWAANSAVQYYDADPARVHVVPFGSNLSVQPSAAEVMASIRERDVEHCQLLFIGVHWVRKGGNVALETARVLHEMGYKVTLNVIGCRPPLDTVPSYVNVIPFLDKQKPADLKKLLNLIMRSHFLVLPSKADCTPIVVNECNSLGVPCLTSDVGGLPEMIREGINGHLFDMEAEGAAYAAAISKYLDDRQAYESLAASAWNEHEEYLGWNASGRQMKKLLQAALNRRPVPDHA